MKSQVLSNFDLPIIPILGLLIFLAVFVGALAWIFRKGSRRFYSKLELAPLEDLKACGPDCSRRHV